MIFPGRKNINCIVPKIVFLVHFLFMCILIVALPGNVSAQKKVTISGSVKDSLTGEVLIGASITINGVNNVGTITNQYGFYSVTVAQGTYTLTATYIGYKAALINISASKNQKLNIELTNNSQLKEVMIRLNDEKEPNVLNTQMGINKLNVGDISAVPVLLGEKDVIKAIELLPGVKSTGDANTGFYVRGGGADQNLILLDGATVYNSSHLFGFFSTFNSDAIKNVSLYKGGMPAQYGGRLSSVLDVKMNDGNNKQYSVEGGIGLIASRIKVEGPIVKNKSSFMISGRRTYADLFLKLSSDSVLNKSSLYFYDLNAKANYQFNDRNTLYLSAYLGADRIAINQNFDNTWGNLTATMRFTHVFNSKLFSNTSLIYSKYKYKVINDGQSNNVSIFSKIEDLNLKYDLEYFISPSNTLSFGASGVYHTIIPGEISSTLSSSYDSTKIDTRYAYELTAYASDQWHLGQKLSVVYGIRLNTFNLVGPGTFYTYSADGAVTSTDTYSAGQSVKRYFNAEPRIALNYILDGSSSVKASYNVNSQNFHLLSNSTSSLPTDLYVMSSNNIKPGIASQLSAGYFRNFKNNQFEFSAETYYKWLDNDIDYKNDARLVPDQNIDNELLYGTGRAFGIEFFMKKKFGNFNGWLGYTLSRTERKFAQLNDGNYFPARQDRTHDISMVNIYKLNKRITLSSVFIYGTGNAVTYPAGKYRVGGITTYYYTNRNASRLPPNSRLDLGVTLLGKQHKFYTSSWTLSVYNALNRKNPYSVTFRDSDTKPPHTEAVETSLFGIIPSITWNFKFN